MIKQEHNINPIMRNSIFLLALFLIYSNCQHQSPTEFKKKQTPSQAGAAMLQWSMARMYPDGKFHTENYRAAYDQMRADAQDRNGSNLWEPLGPHNIGGRTLCLAFNPIDTNIIWAGSASGGLWKSVTGGRGADGWDYVETGFPVLGVSSIAIDPNNPTLMYVGTGEVYNLENSAPNVAIRTTRGTYGIGILKSADGGITWTKSLDWSYGDLRGVQDIKINPLRTATVYAATTEGLLRSYDAGLTWKTINNTGMAVDIEINPVDTNIIYVTNGSLDDNALSGIRRSKDGGNTWTKLTSGLPAAYSGKTMLTISPQDPLVLYASVGNAFVQNGLYRTNNGGDTWTQGSIEDVCRYQGWYSHDVAVKPNDVNTTIWVGIDTWRATNGGAEVEKKSVWSAWYFGDVPAGSSEGPPYYVHADIHRVYFTDDNKFYLATDGGIFVSYDNGDSFEGRNGGYQTQQFYANLGNSSTDPYLAIGGMQDNSTAIYRGDLSWYRVLGGDGECAGISPADDNIMYGSSQYLNVYKNTDSGDINTWSPINSPEMDAEFASFNGPFEISTSNPNIMYAGAQSLHRSDEAGLGFYNATGFLNQGDYILTIAINESDPDEVYCSTVPINTTTPSLFRVNTDPNNTEIVDITDGLPNRYCMDIAVDPVNPSLVYAVFAGFGIKHVWKSEDKGANWTPISEGLPDVPTNSILIDPLNTQHLYVACDLGVWLSKDGGTTWSIYSADAPKSMLAMHLSVTSHRKLRVATYGHGIWQTDMDFVSSTDQAATTIQISQVYPNPAKDQVQITVMSEAKSPVSATVYDLSGKIIWREQMGVPVSGQLRRTIPVLNWNNGTYILTIQTGQSVQSKRFVVVHE